MKSGAEMSIDRGPFYGNFLRKDFDSVNSLVLRKMLTAFKFIIFLKTWAMVFYFKCYLIQDAEETFGSVGFESIFYAFVDYIQWKTNQSAQRQDRYLKIEFAWTNQNSHLVANFHS